MQESEAEFRATVEDEESGQGFLRAEGVLKHDSEGVKSYGKWGEINITAGVASEKEQVGKG